MAKIRIYELARDLNMTNKTLAEKMQEINIPVKTHMSSLEEEEVNRIKQHIHGTPEKEIEITRIKPTIIRRRRIKVTPEPGETDVSAEREAQPEVAKVEAVPSKDAPAGEQPLPEKEPEESEHVQAEPVDAKGVEDGKMEKTDVPEVVDTPVDTPGAALPQKDRKPRIQAVPDPGRPSAAKPLELKTVKPKKKVRKVKKEAAAKIIKLPVVPPAPEKEPKVEKVKKKEPQKITKKTSLLLKTVDKTEESKKDVPAKDKKKKKWTKRPDDIDQDKKFFKKKISFRKKEVVEGKDLYTKGFRGRKGLKTAKAKAAAASQKPQITTPKAIKRRVKIDDTIMLSDLAKRMGIKAGEMIKTLMDLGVMATVNQTIDFDTAVLVAAEFDYELERAAFEEETVLKVIKDDPEKMIKRPPVITIMGHVDHGKTTLLDVIRKTKITENEAGGITQHIGAYHVATDKGPIVFLDTPGHEAFTAMRSRGAKVTDLVILVVAADDGVMPQTIEAINHAKAAKVPIIVAVNKMDKPNADPERVKRELSDTGLVPEDWGGDTVFLEISAKKNEGIEDLLEMILLQAEMLELKANPDKYASGRAVEAKLDSGRGAVATVLVQEGTLHTGDPIVCGIHYGKVRAILNDRGVKMESAGPSIPVEVIGLSGVPQAGDEFIALSDERDAKQISLHRVQKQRARELAKTSRLSLEKLYEQLQEGAVKDLNLILKADVHGSIEAIHDSLTKLSNEEVKIAVIHSATGTITESDVSLAAVSDAIIIGFNVRPSLKTQAFANEESVDIRYYNIIYNVISDVRNAILGLMSSTFEDRTLGRAEVREVFHVPKIGAIAGSYVTDGKIERGRRVRLIRDGIVCFDGRISSLRRFKDDAKEVLSGYECGIGIENYNDIKIGDVIECYYLEEIRPELD
ncbi:MAG: translation initiation factor IF-2 [Pseudomonadota bacterium]